MTVALASAPATCLLLCLLLVLYALGRGFAAQRLCGDACSAADTTLAAPARLFSATFALTLFLLLLILLDLGGALGAADLLLTWRASLAALLFLLLVATPGYALFRSTGPARPARGAALALLGIAALLLALSRLQPASGAPLHARDAQALVAAAVSWAVGRAAVLGVALLAVLAGFGSVHFPHASLSFFVARQDPAACAALERRLLAALCAQATKKKRLALLADERRFSALEQRSSSDPGYAAPPPLSSCSSATPAKGQAGPAFLSSPPPNTPVRRGAGRGILRLFEITRADPAQKTSARHRGFAASPRLDRATEKEVRKQVSVLDDLCRRLAEDVGSAREALHRQTLARTLRGRLDDALGLFMSLFCILHIYRSLRHLLLREADATLDGAQAVLLLSQQAGGGQGGQRLRAAFAASGRYASLVLVFAVITGSLHTFQAAVERLARRTLKSSPASSSAAARRVLLLAAEVTGLYGVSSVLLLRERLPARPRATLTRALGEEVPFRFYADMNDAIYLCSVGATVAWLAARRRWEEGGRGGRWEDA
jgi:hypothetical protein